jgi:molecular chaperone DnaK
MTTVGIDFGTTNSVVAKWSPSGTDVLDIDRAAGEGASPKLMPSVFAAGTEGQALFGWAAKRAQGRRFEAVKRLFATQQEHVTDDAGSVLAVEEVATMLFAELRRAATHAGVPASKAVVTVPANSRGLARHRTKITAGMAGLEVLALLNEPTAAAMAYASNQPGNQQVLVFDWGGGTLDVTILRSVDGIFMEQASKGLPTKGGLDFDTRLSHAVRETIADDHTWSEVDRHIFRLTIELAKIELSTQDEIEVRLPNGDTRRVTRSMFEQAVQPLVEESRRPIEQCLQDLGAGPGIIDAVVMVGGTSKIPLVRRFVSELLNKDPVASVDPMTAVGEGAAIAAAILTGELATNDFFVSTEHALGTVTLSPPSSEPTFSVLIPRNHKLPATSTDRFAPLFEDQQAVTVKVIEGDPDRPVDDPDNVILAEIPVELPEADGSNADRTFSITYHYDTNGILHIDVTDPFTQDLLQRHEISFGVTQDKRRLVHIAKRAETTLETGKVIDQASTDSTDDEVDPETASLLQRAHVKVIPFLDDDDAKPVRDAADRLQQADAEHRPTAKRELQAVLARYPYLF